MPPFATAHRFCACRNGPVENETFECRGPRDAQISCSEYVSLPDLL